jgi:N-acetylglutamate synthase-like GNAT family acetyltransferase
MDHTEESSYEIGQVLLNTRSKSENDNIPTFVPVESEAQIKEVAALATAIWHEHFVSIISLEQIDYMVEKFQSAPAITNQLNNQGYQYYMIVKDEILIGYFGLKEDDKERSLFLSKLYIQKQYRGHGYASFAFQLMVDLCKNKGGRDNISVIVFEGECKNDGYYSR